MSDPVKPEEKSAVLEPPKVTEEVPTTSEVAPAAGVDEVTPVVADASAEESVATEEKKEEKPEPKEITHGTLAKAHGGLLAFFKQKRFFYFQDEPISEDKLKVYLHKDASSRSTAAYASQTGKGLLLYSKTEGQKEVPHGIIKLADVTEVVPTGTTKFVLKLATQELHFESPAAERDSWVFTLNHKINEAKATSEEIINSEGYKTAFEKLTKPTTIATAKAPEKIAEPKEVEAEEVKDAEAKPEKDDMVSTPSEEEAGPADKKADFRRSPSKKNKRTSVFAFLDKKKKPEEKKEDIVEKKEEEQRDDAKPIEQEAVASTVVGEDTPTEIKEVGEADDIEKPAEPATAPKPTKRNSIFGAFTREKKEKEAVEEEKKEEVKAETIEPTEVVATEVKPVDVPTEVTAEKSPASASSPPKPKFFPSFFDKKEKGPVTKVAEKESEPKPIEVTETPAETAETTPAVAIDDSAAPDAASPATSPKEQKRKSSFFSFNKKDKKSEDVKSDSEDTEPTPKSGSTSPLPKAGTGILGLMRKASKSTKHTGKEPESKEVTAPETVAEEPVQVPAATEGAGTVPAEPTAPATTSIEDIVPEAVTVSQPPVQAAA